jgi:hypothetical protein
MDRCRLNQTAVEAQFDDDTLYNKGDVKQGFFKLAGF